MSIKMIFASAAALALAAGAPAFAAKGGQSEQDSAAQAGGGDRADSKGERKTCRTIDKTESRMDRTRLCLTRAQWKKFDDEASQ